MMSTTNDLTLVAHIPGVSSNGNSGEALQQRNAKKQVKFLIKHKNAWLFSLLKRHTCRRHKNRKKCYVLSQTLMTYLHNTRVKRVSLKVGTPDNESKDTIRGDLEFLTKIHDLVSLEGVRIVKEECTKHSCTIPEYAQYQSASEGLLEIAGKIYEMIPESVLSFIGDLTLGKVIQWVLLLVELLTGCVESYKTFVIWSTRLLIQMNVVDNLSNLETWFKGVMKSETPQVEYQSSTFNIFGGLTAIMGIMITNTLPNVKQIAQAGKMCRDLMSIQNAANGTSSFLYENLMIFLPSCVQGWLGTIDTNFMLLNNIRIGGVWNEWFKQAKTLCAVEAQQFHNDAVLMQSLEAAKTIELQIKEYLLSNHEVNNHGFSQAFAAASLEFNTLYTSIHNVESLIRAPPFIAYLYGPSGTGKSVLANILMENMRPVTVSDAMCKWTRTSDKYWDGYKGQNCVLYDDFGTSRNSPDCAEVILMGSCSDWAPPMASLGPYGKGTKFTSTQVVLCSNTKDVEGAQITNADAIKRRRDVVAEIRIDRNGVTLEPGIPHAPNDTYRILIRSTFTDDFELDEDGVPIVFSGNNALAHFVTYCKERERLKRVSNRRVEAILRDARAAVNNEGIEIRQPQRFLNENQQAEVSNSVMIRAVRALTGYVMNNAYRGNADRNVGVQDQAPIVDGVPILIRAINDNNNNGAPRSITGYAVAPIIQVAAQAEYQSGRLDKTLMTHVLGSLDTFLYEIAHGVYDTVDQMLIRLNEIYPNPGVDIKSNFLNLVEDLRTMLNNVQDKQTKLLSTSILGLIEEMQQECSAAIDCLSCSDVDRMHSEWAMLYAFNDDLSNNLELNTHFSAWTMDPLVEPVATFSDLASSETPNTEESSKEEYEEETEMESDASDVSITSKRRFMSASKEAFERRMEEIAHGTYTGKTAKSRLISESSDEVDTIITGPFEVNKFQQSIFLDESESESEKETEILAPQEMRISKDGDYYVVKIGQDTMRGKIGKIYANLRKIKNYVHRRRFLNVFDTWVLSHNAIMALQERKQELGESYDSLHSITSSELDDHVEKKLIKEMKKEPFSLQLIEKMQKLSLRMREKKNKVEGIVKTLEEQINAPAWAKWLLFGGGIALVGMIVGMVYSQCKKEKKETTADVIIIPHVQEESNNFKDDGFYGKDGIHFCQCVDKTCMGYGRMNEFEVQMTSGDENTQRVRHRQAHKGRWTPEHVQYNELYEEESTESCTSKPSVHPKYMHENENVNIMYNTTSHVSHNKKLIHKLPSEIKEVMFSGDDNTRKQPIRKSCPMSSCESKHPTYRHVVPTLNAYAVESILNSGDYNTNKLPNIKMASNIYAVEAKVPKVLHEMVMGSGDEVTRWSKPNIRKQQNFVAEGKLEKGMDKRSYIALQAALVDWQGTSDQNCLNVMDILRMRMLWCTITDSATGQKKSMCMTPIKGTIVLVPRHLFVNDADQLVAEDSLLEIHMPYTYSGGAATFKINFNHKNLVQFRSTEGYNDLALYNLGSRMQSYSDITHHFMSEFPKTDSFSANMVVQGKQGTIIYHTKAILNTTNVVCGSGKQQTTYGTTWKYSASTKPGDCGGLLLAVNTKIDKKIVGMHFAGGVGTDTGYSIPVTQKELNDGMAKLQEKAQLQGYELDIELVNEESTLELNGHFSMIGTVSKQNAQYTSGASDLRRTSIYGQIAPAVTFPAILSVRDKRNVNGIDPMHKALEKYSTSAKPFPTWAVEAAFEDVQRIILADAPHPDALRKLTVLEAINGLGTQYAPSMNMKSSSGFPYTKENIKGGKRGLFIWEDDVVVGIAHKPLEERILERIAKAEKGVRVSSIWTECLKDERRSVEKVESVSTRNFTMAPVDYTIVARMYTLQFCEHFYSKHTETFSAVGINIHSTEWHDMISKMVSVSDMGFGGDYKQYDGKLDPVLVECVAKMIINFYGYTDSDEMVIRVLIDEISHCIRLAGNTLYQTHIGIPSGHPWTAVLNTIVGAMLIRIIYLDIVPVQFRDLIHYNKNVAETIYGDDNLFTVGPLLTKHFNFCTVQAGFLKYGYTYTDAQKSGNVTPLRKITELSFLKCGIGRLNNFYVPLMAENTINEMTNWIRKCSDPERALLDNLNAAMRFKFFYGYDAFMSFKQRVSKAYHGVYGRVPALWSYGYLMGIWINGDSIDGERVKLEGEEYAQIVNFDRGLYRHTGVALPGGMVCHFSRDREEGPILDFLNRKDAHLRIDPIDKVAGGDQVSYGKEKYNLDEVLEKINTMRVGEYGMLDNNCQHVAHEIVGKPRQSKSTKKFVLGTTIVAGAVTTAALAFGMRKQPARVENTVNIQNLVAYGERNDTR